ncbi:MAG TPA: SDR family oxidoreductase [Myxococcaceae bacterium]|nr:SDR family oxidoreductase [Myxococcaceae bacterium]
MPEAGPAQVAVIAGGTRGIGAATARRLAAAGHDLVLGYLQDQRAAEALAEELRRGGRQVCLVRGNVADPEVRARLRAAAAGLGDRCHRLIHCAAVTAFKPLVRVKPNQWNLTLEVSARSLLDLVAELLEPLALCRGAVAAVSSLGSSRFVPAYGALGPAKAALEAVVRGLAVELGPQGIRVNAIRAGLVEGDVLSHFPAGVRDAALARTPLGRLGAPDEIAAALDFVTGPGASWIDGQVIDVDGGYALT